jgi:hypothetical protein
MKIKFRLCGEFAAFLLQKLHVEVIGVYFESHTKHINKGCGISAEFFDSEGGTEF